MAKFATASVLRSLGLRLVELREDRGLTQEHLAELVERNVRHVQRIEAGRSNISIGTLVELANALDVEPRELLAAPTRRILRRPGNPKQRR